MEITRVGEKRTLHPFIEEAIKFCKSPIGRSREIIRKNKERRLENARLLAIEVFDSVVTRLLYQISNLYPGELSQKLSEIIYSDAGAEEKSSAISALAKSVKIADRETKRKVTNMIEVVAVLMERKEEIIRDAQRRLTSLWGHNRSALSYKYNLKGLQIDNSGISNYKSSNAIYKSSIREQKNEVLQAIFIGCIRS